jgi:hypothetical protein
MLLTNAPEVCSECTEQMPLCRNVIAGPMPNVGLLSDRFRQK